MAEWINYNNLPCFIIASKVDEIPKSQVINVCNSFEKQLGLKVFPFSKSNSFYNQDITDYIELLIKS